MPTNVYPAARESATHFNIHGTDAPAQHDRFMAGGQEYRVVSRPAETSYRTFTAWVERYTPGQTVASSPFTATITCF